MFAKTDRRTQKKLDLIADNFTTRDLVASGPTMPQRAGAMIFQAPAGGVPAGGGVAVGNNSNCKAFVIDRGNNNLIPKLSVQVDGTEVAETFKVFNLTPAEIPEDSYFVAVWVSGAWCYTGGVTCDYACVDPPPPPLPTICCEAYSLARCEYPDDNISDFVGTSGPPGFETVYSQDGPSSRNSLNQNCAWDFNTTNDFNSDINVATATRKTDGSYTVEIGGIIWETAVGVPIDCSVTAISMTEQTRPVNSASMTVAPQKICDESATIEFSMSNWIDCPQPRTADCTGIPYTLLNGSGSLRRIDSSTVEFTWNSQSYGNTGAISFGYEVPLEEPPGGTVSGTLEILMDINRDAWFIQVRRIEGIDITPLIGLDQAGQDQGSDTSTQDCGLTCSQPPFDVDYSWRACGETWIDCSGGAAAAFRNTARSMGVGNCRCNDVVGMIETYGDAALDHLATLIQALTSANSTITGQQAEQIIRQYIEGRRDER